MIAEPIRLARDRRTGESRCRRRKKTAVISTVTGESNAHLYGELIKQQIDLGKMPFMALSVSERELGRVELGKLAGLMAARNYFQSVKSSENDAFIKIWGES